MIFVNNQQYSVINAIKNDGTISSKTAFNYGIGGLTSRISELRKLGVPIKDKTKKIVKADGSKSFYYEYYIDDISVYDKIYKKVGKVAS